MRIFLLIFFCSFISSISLAQKSVFIPPEWDNDPYLQNWSWDRSYESENFVVFWGPELSGDPVNQADPALKFNPQAACDTLEVSYRKFVEELGFVSDSPSTNMGKYKIIVVINDTWGDGGPSGWAFGGSYSETIGTMWVAPAATRNGMVLSHEFAHTLQSMNWIQENTGGGGFINYEPAGFFWETHANFMRAQLYPSLAKEDTPRWLATRMFHWSSTRHHYAAFRLLFHIQRFDGIEIVNRLWKESLPDEHPLMTYRRLKGWSQSQLNDFIFDYAKRDVTFDYPVLGMGEVLRRERERLRRDEPHYLWREFTIPEQIDAATGRYIVSGAPAPQDYGMNIIPLHPSYGTGEVRVKFKGHSEGNVNAGWRYGFVTVNTDGSVASYGPVYSKEDKEFTYKTTDGSKLFLVVTGAPAEHTSYEWEPGWPRIRRFPYELRIDGAVPEGYQPGFRNVIRSRVEGSLHPNGGGFVASTALVSPNAFIGSEAVVLGGSQVGSGVRVEDRAWVEDADLSGNASVNGDAKVFGGSFSDQVQITGLALAYHTTATGDALLKDNVFSWGSTYGGDVVVGGDAEIGDCSSGVYLQVPHPNNGRTHCDGEGTNHPSNHDINLVITPFSETEMIFTESGAEAEQPTQEVSLLANSPNPMYLSTSIGFTLPEQMEVTLKIYDITGREVATPLRRRMYTAGAHTFEWTAPDNLSSGVYIYLLKTGRKLVSRKLTYIKR